VDRVIEVVRHYRMPLKDRYVFYLPDTLKIVDGNRDIAYLMDSCSIPIAFKTLVRRLKLAFPDYSIEVIESQIIDMLKSGLLLEHSVKTIEKVKPNPIVENASITFNDVTIHVTDSCNLECLYCYNKEEREKQKRRELSVEKWKLILDDIIAYNKPEVITISGGEPLTYPDVQELVDYISLCNIKTGIITNGTMSDTKSIETLSRFDSVVVSLDSHIEKINNQSRGAGSYKKVLDTLDILEANGIPFGVNTVLTSFNIETFGETITYLTSRYKNLQNVFPIFQEATHWAPQIVPSRAQMDRYYETDFRTMIRDKENEQKLIATWGESLLCRTSCGIAANEFAVTTDGGIIPCRAMYFEEMNGGKLNGTNFRETWENSEILNRVRKANNQRGSACREVNCDFQSICLGGCLAHAYSATGKLKPFADELDCYRFKQLCMLKMHIKIKTAKNEKL